MGKKLVAGIVGGIGFVGIGLYAMFGKKDNAKKLVKYSMDWIRNLTDEEWKIEREFVRKEIHCNPNVDMKLKEEAFKWLRRFDDVWRERHGTGNVHIPYRREHGFNLYKPD